MTGKVPKREDYDRPPEIILSSIPWMGRLTKPGVFGAPPVEVEVQLDMLYVHFTYRPGEKRDLA